MLLTCLRSMALKAFPSYHKSRSYSSLHALVPYRCISRTNHSIDLVLSLPTWKKAETPALITCKCFTLSHVPFKVHMDSMWNSCGTHVESSGIYLALLPQFSGVQMNSCGIHVKQVDFYWKSTRIPVSGLHIVDVEYIS